MPDVQPLGIAKLTNGWLVGTYAPMMDASKEGTLIAVRISDGYTLTSTLPAPYAWGPIASRLPGVTPWAGPCRRDDHWRQRERR